MAFSLALLGASTYEVPIPLTVDYLVIAGGGGGGAGGNTGNGGGGAGGYRTSAGTSGGGASAESSLSLVVSTNYTVTIGAGGSTKTKGVDSSFYAITSNGGGFGGYRTPDTNPADGGAGGGSQSIAGVPAGIGSSGQGYDGGTGYQGSNFPYTFRAGGGGGAGQAGNTSGQCNGGNGLASSITGGSITRGGGGAGQASFGGGSGGTGGGGSSGSPGATNTGGGGGQASTGGSGVVIIKYPDTYTITVGAGLTYDPPITDGAFKITVLKSGTGNVSWAA